MLTAKDKSDLLAAGAGAADFLIETFLENGCPLPWPEAVEDVPEFVEAMVPYGRSAFAYLAGGTFALKKDAGALIDEGFRARFGELVVVGLTD